MKKSIFIGSVLSSKVALETMIEIGVKFDLVCSLDESASNNVSDYYPLHQIAEKYEVPVLKFKKINEKSVQEAIKSIMPDFIFVIGFSQIISSELLALAQEYAIGFHPTALPKYRGRAAIPWQILLGESESMISVFRLDEEMDSGDIIYQSPYSIEARDYARDVYNKICIALSCALKECVPQIYNHSVKFIKQNHEEATYLLARRPEDGKINWNLTGREIETLIRATSKPYPGAFAYYKNSKVIFWRARIENNCKYIGVPGQLAWMNDANELGIITKDSILIVSDYEFIDSRSPFVLGHKFI